MGHLQEAARSKQKVSVRISELNSEAELYVTRTYVGCSCHASKIAATQRRVRASELRGVRNVEHLSAELSLDALTPAEVLQDGEVRVVGGTKAYVGNPARRIANFVLTRGSECGGVEPTIRRRILYRGRSEIGNDVRSLHLIAVIRQGIWRREAEWKAAGESDNC